MESQLENLKNNPDETKIKNLGVDIDLLKALYNPDGQKNLINNLNKQFPPKP